MSVLTLGIDTSNYTTSVALSEDGKIIFNEKILLDVPAGERGVRQSDAVFLHTKNLPVLFEKLGERKLDAVGVSVRPRDVEGSYMPCFLAGLSSATAISAVNGIERYEFSHQAGHIMAALYSCQRTDLVSSEFIAFHVSGGTTEMLLVDNMYVTRIGGTLDLNAGQLIDRIGVKLGYSFPCGLAMDKELVTLDSADCSSCVRGFDCHFSGLENQADKLISSGADKKTVVAFVFKSVMRTLDKMTRNALDKYGELPVIYAGGVTGNRFISSYLEKKYGAYFASPEFSADNAAGAALLAHAKYIKS